jgi:hypothetical protein
MYVLRCKVKQVVTVKSTVETEGEHFQLLITVKTEYDNG